MPNAAKLSQKDLSTIDLRTVTPEDWEAIKHEVNRRAHAERARVIKAVVAWLCSLWAHSTRNHAAPAQRGGLVNLTSLARPT